MASSHGPNKSQMKSLMGGPHRDYLDDLGINVYMILERILGCAIDNDAHDLTELLMKDEVERHHTFRGKQFDIVNVKNSQFAQFTAVEVAVMRGSQDVLRVLLANGADFNIKDTGEVDCEERQYLKYGLFSLAVKTGDEDMMMLVASAMEHPQLARRPFDELVYSGEKKRKYTKLLIETGILSRKEEKNDPGAGEALLDRDKNIAENLQDSEQQRQLLVLLLALLVLLLAILWSSAKFRVVDSFFCQQR